LTDQQDFTLKKKILQFWYFKMLIKRLSVYNYSKSYWNILLPTKVYRISLAYFILTSPEDDLYAETHSDFL